MKVWRICKKIYARTAYNGMGAKESGGRWNHKGSSMVYASTNLSLASLELFVNLEPKFMPDDLISVSAIIPDHISQEHLTIKKLPKNWRDYPAPTKLMNLGTKWIQEQRSLVLFVPSAINPEELNVLINPFHPEFSEIGQFKSKSFRFDPRMWKK